MTPANLVAAMSAMADTSTPAPATAPVPSRRRPAPDLVTVVIPVRNGADTLGRQLEALGQQTYRGSWEVVVADNGSTDGTTEAAEAFRDRVPGLRVVDASRGRGVSGARNAGARAARGQFITYCDADDEATEGWLAGLVSAASEHDVVGGRLDHASLNDDAVRAWRVASAVDRLPTSLDFLPYAFGSNLGIASHVLRALGGWNETYAGGGDDVELCWRAQLAGYSLGFAPAAVMRYRHRDDVRGTMKQAYGYGLLDPRLYIQFRSAGVPPRSVGGGLRGWAVLAAHVPDLLGSRARQGRWLRQASLKWGRLRGSVRHGVWCP